MTSRAASNPSRSGSRAKARSRGLAASRSSRRATCRERRRNGGISSTGARIAVHAEARPRLLLGAERRERGECCVTKGRVEDGRPELEQSGHDAAVGRDALERLGEGGLRRLQILLEPRRQLGGPGSPDTGVRRAGSIPPGRHRRSMSSCRHYSRGFRSLGSVSASGARSSRRKVRLIRSPMTLAWRGTPWT